MRFRIALLTVAVAASAVIAAPLHAQQEPAVAALRASMDASAHAAFTETLRDAAQRGLPTAPLIAKAQEGAAKNVPGARIVSAVRETAVRLGRAQVLLRPAGTPTGEDISAVATALQRGVPEDAIARMARDARGRAHVALSAHVLADLLGHGVPVAVGVDAIAAWRGRSTDVRQLNEIPAAVERLVRQGVVPARAGAAVAAGLRLGRTPGSITPGEVPRILRGGRGPGQ